MIAARKGTVIDSVIYAGEEERYPRWFQEEVLNWTVTNPDGYQELILSDETDDEFVSFIFVPWKSVILRNKYGDIHHIHIDRFLKHYYPIGVYNAARIEDTIEYHILDLFNTFDKAPKWVQDLYYENDDSEYELERYFITENEVINFEGALARQKWHPYVFIRNQSGDTRMIPMEDFANNFDVCYPKYI